MQYFTFINIKLNIFHYIFTILNGFQGLWIALIYLYENRKKFRKLKLRKVATEQTFVNYLPKISTGGTKSESDKFD